MIRRVLVLRDAESAGETARDLMKRDLKALLLPVQEIAPLRDPPPDGAFAAILATSRNAAPALRRYFAGTALPILAVGEGTGAALRAAGFADVDVGAGDAASLVAPAAGLARRARLPLLLALGRRRTDTLEEGLARAGVSFTLWETYEARMLRPSRGAVEAVLADGPADAVLLLSQAQAEGFVRLLGDHPDLFQPRPALHCLSERIAAALSPELRGLARISPAPDLSLLFDGLAGTNLSPYCLAGSPRDEEDGTTPP